ncbi:MAG: GNAT family N-acetyltransferase [Clostridia bacterium]|nr:GNAT family N-acetyltransferase [Clostridia bacterium]
MVIKLFGKNIFAVYSHYIMRITASSAARSDDEGNYSLKSLNLSEFDSKLLCGSTLGVPALKRLSGSNGENCEGFVLTSCSSDETLGTIWLMYRGGNDIEYRIRNIDAYIFDVFVSPSERGKGIAGIMIAKIMNHLKEQGIDSAYLAVSKKNTSAIKAYRKSGFEICSEKAFARVLKVNIPYHKL